MTSFLFLDNIKKNQEKLRTILNTFENIMEDGVFAPKEQVLHFHIIFKNMIFQRCSFGVKG